VSVQENKFVEVSSVTALLKLAYPLVIRKVIGQIADQARKPIKAGKEKFLKAWGTPSPELAAVLQNVIAKAYVVTVGSIVNSYLDEQNAKTFRTPGDIEHEEKLREALKALQKKKLYEIAPSIETINILPAAGNAHHVGQTDARRSAYRFREQARIAPTPDPV
jgi:hypothetical protein